MRKLKAFLTISACCLALSLSSKAQEGTELTAGFDTNSYNPFYIQSTDGDYSLHIGGYTQIRYNAIFLNNTPADVESTPRGYNMARTRLYFEGKASEKFNYHIRLNINTDNKVEVMIAYLQWNLKKNMSIRFGRQFMALGREDWLFAQNLSAIDFSANDFTYAIWTSYGAQFNHTVNDHFKYWLGVSNGSYGSRASIPKPQSSNLSFTTRLEWNLMGNGWDKFDDMLGRKGRNFGMSIGLGGLNTTVYDPTELLTSAKNLSQVNLDYTVSGNGFQFFVQGTAMNYRYANTLTNLGQDRTTYGLYATFGYWFSDQLFSYLRYDNVSTGNADAMYATENYSSPGIGAAIYPFTWTNRIRVNLEYNYLPSTLNNTLVVPDAQLGIASSTYGGQQSVRFQVQFGF